MRISIAVKSICAAAVASTGLLSKVLDRRSGGVAILMYHRVFPREAAVRFRIQPGMYVQPDTFENHLRFLTNRFEILPIRETPEVLEAEGRAVAKPRCVLTFDDGWSDFRLHAFPLLQKYRVPATNFLPTDFIGCGDRFWTDRFVALFGTLGDRDDLCGDSGDPLVNRLIGLTGNRESRIEEAIAILKQCRQKEIEKTLAELARISGAGPDYTPGSDFLSWDEVRFMASSGLVSFGSHTATHRILMSLSRDEIRGELDRSRERLLAEGVADPAFVPFCYPDGSHDAEI